MSKHFLKEEAIKLRNQGYSYSYIRSKINVSKSTLSVWLRSLPYKPNEYSKAKLVKAREASALAKRKILLESIDLAEREAEGDVRSLNKRDIFILGLGLYIGEGSKTKNIIRIVNSDPKILRFMIRWFEEVCNVPKKNFRMRVHLYPDNNIEESKKYWSEVTQIPDEQFFKCQIDQRVNKNRNSKGKLPYGTAHLSVTSRGNKSLGVHLSRKICAWSNLVLG